MLHYPQRDRGRLSGIGGCGVRLSAFGGGLPRGWHVVPPREQTSKRANEQTSKRANEQTSKRANE
ncbi:hypothetical protein, partial [Burkholderia sp. SIMBA_048]|uniref:hypothetical protein n=1 Tax=unclassified Burkholderia TaxID=2613784 RepID=UPI00397C31BE